MNTKLLMISSSFLMGILGVCFIFLPAEIIHSLKMADGIYVTLLIQLAGALYFGFGTLNYMARGNIIGGVYSKPLALGNFANFFIGGMILLKVLFVHSGMISIWILFGIYLLFAILFGLILFRHPG